VYVFDIGQQISGWCRLTVTGSAGTNVTLRHAEVLVHGSGMIYTKELRGARATDTYILRGATDGRCV